MKQTATVLIEYEPDNEEGELQISCKFDPDVKMNESSVVCNLAMIAVKAIGEACKVDQE